MGKSVNRVRAAAAATGLEIEIITLPVSARTAAKAAAALDCDVGQIAKSLLFEGADSGALKLILVSGTHDLDMTNAPAHFGEKLIRADPKRVRTDTGFAIGGVAPIGHLCEIETFMDSALVSYDRLWAAGGAPETVFAITPAQLLSVTGATLFDNS